MLVSNHSAVHIDKWPQFADFFRRTPTSAYVAPRAMEFALKLGNMQFLGTLKAETWVNLAYLDIEDFKKCLIAGLNVYYWMGDTALFGRAWTIPMTAQTINAHIYVHHAVNAKILTEIEEIRHTPRPVSERPVSSEMSDETSAPQPADDQLPILPLKL